MQVENFEVCMSNGVLQVFPSYGVWEHDEYNIEVKSFLKREIMIDVQWVNYLQCPIYREIFVGFSLKLCISFINRILFLIYDFPFCYAQTLNIIANILFVAVLFIFFYLGVLVFFCLGVLVYFSLFFLPFFLTNLREIRSLGAHLRFKVI